jgi:hypothetical protein
MKMKASKINQSGCDFTEKSLKYSMLCIKELYFHSHSDRDEMSCMSCHSDFKHFSLSILACVVLIYASSVWLLQHSNSVLHEKSCLEILLILH